MVILVSPGSFYKNFMHFKLESKFEEHSGKEMKPFFAELFVKYLCDRLTNTPTALNPVFLKQISKVLPE